jgi:hypothetical protein
MVAVFVLGVEGSLKQSSSTYAGRITDVLTGLSPP